MLPAGFETEMPSRERRKTHALDGAATRIVFCYYSPNKCRRVIWIQCYTELYSVIKSYSVIQCYIVLYRVIQCYTELYSVIQSYTVLYRVIQCYKKL